VRLWQTAALAWTLVAALAANAAPAVVLEVLRTGSQAFREGRYAEALVAFRAAERLPVTVGEARWYSAATLYKLGRVEEALEAFGEAERAAPELRDGVLDFYAASAAFEARLYLTADERLATLSEQAGPKLGAEVRRLRERIAPLFARPPESRSIDWYLARAEEERRSARKGVARLFFAEAAALARRTPAPHHRLAEALSGLEASR
jgi:tetratricopeptide (TPR) repeat protein